MLYLGERGAWRGEMKFPQWTCLSPELCTLSITPSMCVCSVCWLGFRNILNNGAVARDSTDLVLSRFCSSRRSAFAADLVWLGDVVVVLVFFEG